MGRNFSLKLEETSLLNISSLIPGICYKAEIIKHTHTCTHSNIHTYMFNSTVIFCLSIYRSLNILFPGSSCLTVMKSLIKMTTGDYISNVKHTVHYSTIQNINKFCHKCEEFLQRIKCLHILQQKKITVYNVHSKLLNEFLTYNFVK